MHYAKLMERGEWHSTFATSLIINMTELAKQGTKKGKKKQITMWTKKFLTCTRNFYFCFIFLQYTALAYIQVIIIYLGSGMSVLDHGHIGFWLAPGQSKGNYLWKWWRRWESCSRVVRGSLTSDRLIRVWAQAGEIDTRRSLRPPLQKILI